MAHACEIALITTIDKAGPRAQNVPHWPFALTPPFPSLMGRLEDAR